jgi:hypothetical protein
MSILTRRTRTRSPLESTKPGISRATSAENQGISELIALGKASNLYGYITGGRPLRTYLLCLTPTPRMMNFRKQVKAFEVRAG